MARFLVAKNGVQKTILEPRMNQYQAMRDPIGTPDVYSTIGGDFYLSILNIDAGQAERCGERDRDAVHRLDLVRRGPDGARRD